MSEIPKDNKGLTLFGKGKRMSGEAAHFEPIGGLEKWGKAHDSD